MVTKVDVKGEIESRVDGAVTAAGEAGVDLKNSIFDALLNLFKELVAVIKNALGIAE